MSWYAKKSAGPGQGLVIDEETGRTVAVTFDEKDAPLLAASKDLLAALEVSQETIQRQAELLRHCGAALGIGGTLHQSRLAIEKAKETIR